MPEAISTDDLFDALSNGRRRQVIRELETGDHTIGTLAEAVARDENEIPDSQDVPGDRRKAVYIALYQGHLKTLHDADIVEWDKERGTVDTGAAHATALDVLESVTGGEGTPVLSERLTTIVGEVTGR